ncbi:hypothetical protein KKA23_01730 [Patescibacteria group bacterium]|nr:hypothetical protein [Patescibacteria group bacterium]
MIFIAIFWGLMILVILIMTGSVSIEEQREKKKRIIREAKTRQIHKLFSGQIEPMIEEAIKTDNTDRLEEIMGINNYIILLESRLLDHGNTEKETERVKKEISKTEKRILRIQEQNI